MSWLKKLTLITAPLLSASSLLAAEASHGVASAAEPLFDVFGLPVTNSIVTSWVVAFVLIVAIRLAVKRPKLVPTRGQAVVESLVQGVLDLITPIVGSRVARHTFPLLVGLFVFILIQNWSGLFPGVGTVYMVDHKTGHWMEFVRPGNADLNATLALSTVAFFGWLYFVLRYAGVKALAYDLFGNKAERKEIPAAIYYLLFVIFFLVGMIEVVSIMVRPISLSLRLYGNVFGGENLMHAMASMFSWGLPVPFYFLEVLIGFVQALVFTLLVSVYIGLICNHGDDHAEEGSHGAKPAVQH